MIIIALAAALLAQTPTDGSAPTTSSATPTKATAKLVELRAFFDELKCEKVVENAKFVIDHREATQSERLEAMFQKAYCLVVLGNISEASGVFTEIVREKIDAQAPFDVEPRVQVLLDAARVEEQKRIADEEAKKRASIVAKIKIDVDEPSGVNGGSPAVFIVHLVDPESSVKSMRVDFKREGDAELFGLPISKRDDGTWRGEIPGAYTRSKLGMTLLWFVTASDDAGAPLVSVGTRDEPRRLFVSAGTVRSDLKANERFSHPVRLAFGSAGAGGMSAVLLFAGTAAVQELIADDNGNFSFGKGFNVDELALVLTQGALATGGMYLVSVTLIDGWQQMLPALVTGSVTSIYALACLFTDANPVYLQNRSIAAGSEGVAAVLAFSVVAGAATATTLIFIDPPAE